MARLILNTFGSLGDLHPYLAIAIGLRRRGHQPIVATAEVYREKVQAEGIDFWPVRPNIGELLDQPEFLKKIWHPRRGSEYLLRDYVLPHVQQSFDDLMQVCPGSDLLLTHAAAYAGPIAAEASHVPWLSVVLQPMMFFSPHDPSVVPAAAWLRYLYRFGSASFRALMLAAEFRTRRWVETIQRVRTRAGLARSTLNPMTRGQFSQLGTLALFSPHYAKPQPDWPPNVRVTGFVFYDRQGSVPGAQPENPRPEELARFLADGRPPILFTLGSSAVMQPGTFFRESVLAARLLDSRAVLLTGSLDPRRLDVELPETIYLAPYLRYSEIMSASSVIVHQGGIGTTAQALRSGRPMLVVPWAHDQPDNAERVRKLGVARTIPRAHYKASRVAREIETLLKDGRYRDRAAGIAVKIASEDGVTAACAAIEETLGLKRS